MRPAHTPVIIKCTELVQAGDLFLLRVACPFCQVRLLTGVQVASCDHCHADLSLCLLEIPPRGKHRLLSGTRRKRKAGLNKSQINALLEIQCNLCAYCDRAMDTYHVEHIRPLSIGGTNNFDNLCIACPRCNLLASDLVFPDRNAKRAYVRLQQNLKA